MGVRGIAPSKEGAFGQAALAMIAVVTDLNRVNPTEAVTIACEAPDDELLLADWLNALIYEMATRKIIFGRVAVKIADHRLEATAWGEPVLVAKHQPAVEVKGATYTSLSVTQDRNGTWVAQCVVDV